MRISDWSSDVCSSDLGAEDRLSRYALAGAVAEAGRALSLRRTLGGNGRPGGFCRRRLGEAGDHAAGAGGGTGLTAGRGGGGRLDLSRRAKNGLTGAAARNSFMGRPCPFLQIGSASCRESVCQSV